MKKVQKGIVLITTMLLLSFIIMIASLLIVTGKNTLLLGSTYNEREKALYAAESGLAYAQYCLSKNPKWNASSVFNTGFSEINIEMPSSRCVHGTLKRDSAEFYIAFSNGATITSANDILDRSNVPLKYYSFNNLLGSADNNSQYFNSGTSRVFKTVPTGYAHIIVEGRCNTARKYTEAMLKIRDDVTGLACSMAAGDVDIKLTDDTSTFLVNSSGTQDCKIRSMGNINVASSTTDKNPYQIANKGVSYTSSGYNTVVNGATIDSASESTDYGVNYNNTEDQSAFLKKAKISWDTAAGDFVSGTTYTSNVTTKVPGGTWVYRNSDTDASTYKLYYYPATLTADNAKTFLTDNDATKVEYSTGGSSLVSGSGITFQDNVNKSFFNSNANYLITINSPVGITEDTGTTTNSFCSAVFDYDSDSGTYLPSTSCRASVQLNGTSAGLITTDGSTSGSVYIDGELSGEGKVLSSGSLTFQGHSALQADNNSGGISVYAKGNIQVDPVKGDTSETTTAVNTVLAAAWDKYTGSSLYIESSSGGEYTTKTDKYADLREQLLQLTLSSYGNRRLIDVLTDTGGLAYDSDTAQNLVDTLLAKNTYLGNNVSSSYDLTEHGFWGWGSGEQWLNNSFFTQGHDVKKVNGTNRQYVLIVGVKNGLTDDLKVSFNNVAAGTYTVSDFPGYIENAVGASYAGNYLSDVQIVVTGTNEGYITYTYKNQSYKSTIDSDSWAGGKISQATGSSDTIVMYGTSDDHYNPLIFNDTILKGLIYTWENIYGPNLQGGSFTVRGGVVAYGGNPGTQEPGDNGKGSIEINNAKAITFTYDPTYMGMLLSACGCGTKRVFQANF